LIIQDDWVGVDNTSDVRISRLRFLIGGEDCWGSNCSKPVAFGLGLFSSEVCTRGYGKDCEETEDERFHENFKML
jgi:hypothetical protein